MKSVQNINYLHGKMARAGLGLTVRELAEAAGLDKATIVRFEAGIKTRITTVEKIRNALESFGAEFPDFEGGLGVAIHDDKSATSETDGATNGRSG